MNGKDKIISRLTRFKNDPVAFVVEVLDATPDERQGQNYIEAHPIQE